MLFQPLAIEGAMRVRIDPFVDERGLFARTFCQREFAAHGIPLDFVQASVSYNSRRGTLRGLHFQWPPSAEGKLVRCVRGSVFDVLVDLRPGSGSYLDREAVELDERGRDAIFVPPGVAHGFLTLEDATEVLYQMSDYYASELSAGFAWNDPAFGIEWPSEPTVISDKDAAYPSFDRARHEAELARRGGTWAAQG